MAENQRRELLTIHDNLRREKCEQDQPDSMDMDIPIADLHRDAIAHRQIRGNEDNWRRASETSIRERLSREAKKKHSSAEDDLCGDGFVTAD